ncbi:hypothetical protein AX15_004329 [Amanita polypyramis BW_CC]|nr:hypothetical protein AX15_004329 [Amanita polypyramis BW_CC]
MSPTDDEKDDLLLSCRYGDMDDVRQFVDKHGQDFLGLVRDENGNCVLHMVAGNGHTDILDYILPIVPPSLLSAQNNAGSTPLHWAAINSQLDVAKKLVQFPTGPGADLIDIRNTAGRSPLAEAEMAGWDEGAKYIVQVMNINETKGNEGVDEGAVIRNERHSTTAIRDADDRIAEMTMDSNAHT